MPTFVFLCLWHDACVMLSGVHIPRAVLLHGPSGTGKTLLAKALAHSLQLQLVQITGSAFLSPYVSYVFTVWLSIVHKTKICSAIIVKTLFSFPLTFASISIFLTELTCSILKALEFKN